MIDKFFPKVERPSRPREDVLERLAPTEFSRQVHLRGRKVGYKPSMTCTLVIKGGQEAWAYYTLVGHKQVSTTKRITPAETPASVQDILRFWSDCFEIARDFLDEYDSEIGEILEKVKPIRKEYKKTGSRKALAEFKRLARRYWILTGNTLRINGLPEVPDTLPKELSGQLVDEDDEEIDENENS